MLHRIKLDMLVRVAGRIDGKVGRVVGISQDLGECVVVWEGGHAYRIARWQLMPARPFRG